MEITKEEAEVRAFVRGEIENYFKDKAEEMSARGKAFEQSVLKQVNDFLLRDQEINGKWAEKVQKDIMNNLKSVLPTMNSQILIGAINSVIFSVTLAITLHFLR